MYYFSNPSLASIYIISSTLLCVIDAMVDKRSTSADYVALAPHVLEGLEQLCERADGQFPELQSDVLLPPTSE